LKRKQAITGRRWKKLLDRFSDYGKVEYNNDTKELMIFNWIKYNKINSPKVKQCIVKELKKVKHQPFVDRFYRLCKQFGYPMNTVSVNYGEEQEKEEEQENEKKGRCHLAYDDNSPYLQLAQYLLDKIKSWKPDFVFRGDLQKWANDFRLMCDNDHRLWESIVAVIDWATNDPFWQTKIMSAEKLRKQFDALEGQMRNERDNVRSMPQRYIETVRPNALSSQPAVSPIALERERRKREQQRKQERRGGSMGF
jgi:hypothetical protein